MRILPMAVVAAFFAIVTGCASGPTVRADADPNSDFTRYRTFGFFEPLATDRAGYSTILSSRLKEATRRQMEQRGYRYAESSPDLRVNFFVNTKEKQEVVSTPAPFAGGYYRYRRGFYQPWAGYPYDVHTMTYTQGTLSIDLVDTERKQLIWQGLAKGMVTQKVRDNPTRAIDDAVAKIFAQFPGKGG